MKGIVYLVGGGCGGADLITVRGRRCLERADAVLYDDLVDEDLLVLAPAGAELVCVGKRRGRHSMPQEEINALLVSKAAAGKVVCRLKGGDPFVFGRGGEELAAVRAAGVGCLVVPGVSSAVAVPGGAGIPVTHRGVSRSFHVVTAHTAGPDGGMPDNLEGLAALEGTLVFLMGLHRLDGLCRGLVEAGMSPSTPAAVVGARCIRGTLADLAGKARGLEPPAVILVGGTAGMDLRAGLPLSGACVGLTGTAAFREKFVPGLEGMGAAVRCLQRSRVRPLCAPEELTQALDWASGGWLGFTSPNGAAVFFALLARAGWDLRGLARFRIAAVGPGTAAELARHGFRADLIPPRHDTQCLGERMARVCGGRRALLLRAAEAAPGLEAPLLQAGASCRTVPLYALSTGPVCRAQVDYAVFGSAGGVREYAAGGGPAPGRGAVCIGPRTAAEAERIFSRVLTADDAAPEAVIACILKDWGDFLCGS